MTADEKLTKLETVLNITDPTGDQENTLLTYLELAGCEILAWRYSYADEMPEEVPAEFETTQIFAVVNGYNQQGAEGQSMHSENNLYMTFSYPDMVNYIHRNVVPYAKVI